MKFNLSDFLQLDTKGLLAVNGGFNCNGSTNNTVYPNTYYSGNGESPNGGGGNDHNGNKWYSKGDIVDSIPRGGTFIKSDGKSFTYSFGSGKSKNTTTFQKNPDGTYLVTYNHYDGPVTSNGSKNSGGSSGGGSCSTPSSSPDFSSGGSNNPNGQGYSQTSSNPGKNSGDKGKKDDSPQGGGTCPGKDGGTYIPADNGSGDAGIPNGGGICGGTGGSGEGETETGGEELPNTDGEEITNPDDTMDKTSGSFGQITDGSYADLLTMQYYKNNPSYMFHPGANDEAMYGIYTDGDKTHDCIFSKVGCVEAGTAKMSSEILGEDVPLIYINNLFDTDKDGDLSLDEIAAGIDMLLDSKYGDIYDVIGENIDNVSLSELNKASTPADGDITFVLGKAPDCHGGHWVVLEGYSTNENGVVIFSYDGTSDNDVGRTFILGKENQDSSKEIWGITRIETFTVHKK